MFFRKEALAILRNFSSFLRTHLCKTTPSDSRISFEMQTSSSVIAIRVRSMQRRCKFCALRQSYLLPAHFWIELNSEREIFFVVSRRQLIYILYRCSERQFFMFFKALYHEECLRRCKGHPTQTIDDDLNAKRLLTALWSAIACNRSIAVDGNLHTWFKLTILPSSTAFK